jgi:beta-alanine--pyruvate transaminase
MHYTDVDGNQVLDGTAGLWCVNAGHCREPIVAAIQKGAATLDYAPGFNMGHPLSFQLATRVAAMLPGDLDHVFFGNSGSEAVDTALKIAIAYHVARGEPQRKRLVGRVRGYHGVGFGGISVGGLETNRKVFASHLVPHSDEHLPQTHGIPGNFFSRGQPAEGAHLADALQEMVDRHGGDTIAAVIVEPVAGSAGVLVPPQGYLEKLRAICDRHGILLIFDEVITGFGRLGSAFGATYFGITPDLMTIAKGLTNGAVPMGAVCVRRGIYESVVNATESGSSSSMVILGTSLASAAGLATLALYEHEDFQAPGARAVLGECGPLAARRAAHRRRPQPRPRGGNRAGPPSRKARRAGDGGTRGLLPPRCADPGDRRHHRVVATPHHRARADRPVGRDVRRRAEANPVAWRRPLAGSPGFSSPSPSRRSPPMRNDRASTISSFPSAARRGLSTQSPTWRGSRLAITH